MRSAIVAAGAVAALQLAYFTVTSGPGCTLVAGSRTACMQGSLAVAVSLLNAQPQGGLGRGQALGKAVLIAVSQGQVV